MSDIDSDRFIPRRSGNNWQTTFSMLTEYNLKKTKQVIKNCNKVIKRDEIAYSCLLENELLGANNEDVKGLSKERKILSPLSKNLFKYTRPTKAKALFNQISPYSLSPLSEKSQKILRSPKEAVRKISQNPFKILSAPYLQDDFYLNLVDWSSQNLLAVGLGMCIYLWSPSGSEVTKLNDLSEDFNRVSSVSWNDKGNYLAVGTQHGYIKIYDTLTNKLVHRFYGHIGGVGSLAWNGDILSSGSRDKIILQNDVRVANYLPTRKLEAHRQEVIGLKWSPDKQYLASGGNDNRLHIWNAHSPRPVQTYTKHCAAVKALAWSPHQHGLLASGGGTADKSIKFWNTLTGQLIQSVSTGAQVCNLLWSKHSNELVSTHGYSQNNIFIWKYPNLTQIATLSGHTHRVLYLAMSPDGEVIVTGSGDETLRFWNVFSKCQSQKENKSVLNLFKGVR